MRYVTLTSFDSVKYSPSSSLPGLRWPNITSNWERSEDSWELALYAKTQESRYSSRSSFFDSVYFTIIVFNVWLQLSSNPFANSVHVCSRVKLTWHDINNRKYVHGCKYLCNTWIIQINYPLHSPGDTSVTKSVMHNIHVGLIYFLYVPVGDKV